MGSSSLSEEERGWRLVDQYQAVVAAINGALADSAAGALLHPCAWIKKVEGVGECGSCGAAMTHQTWESSDGAYEDSKYSCPNGHVEWVDGIDS